MGTKPSKPCPALGPRAAFSTADEIDDDLEDGRDIPVGSCDECESNIYAHDVDNLCGQCAWWRRAAR